MQNTNVTIPNGACISEPIDCQEYVPVALLMPAAWTAAGISFLAAHGPDQSVNKVQTVVHTATGGTWKITVNGVESGTIAYNASVATVLAAIEALSTVEVGDVAVSGSAGSYTLTWQGLLAGGADPTVSANFGSLTGGTGTLTTTTDGTGPTFRPIYDADGVELVASVDASRHVALAPDGLRSARWLRLRSGTAALQVAQGAARTVGVVLVTDVGS